MLLANLVDDMEAAEAFKQGREQCDDVERSTGFPHLPYSVDQKVST
jgi:hypothetical protein